MPIVRFPLNVSLGGLQRVVDISVPIVVLILQRDGIVVRYHQVHLTFSILSVLYNMFQVIFVVPYLAEKVRQSFGIVLKYMLNRSFGPNHHR